VCWEHCALTGIWQSVLRIGLIMQGNNLKAIFYSNLQIFCILTVTSFHNMFRHYSFRPLRYNPYYKTNNSTHKKNTITQYSLFSVSAGVAPWIWRWAAESCRRKYCIIVYILYVQTVGFITWTVSQHILLTWSTAVCTAFSIESSDKGSLLRGWSYVFMFLPHYFCFLKRFVVKFHLFVPFWYVWH
jgi:hypothetical protein